MSDIEKHLRWLRNMGGRTNIEALDAIEALVKERDAALSVRPSMQAWIDHHYARAEAAEAEVERLKGVLGQIQLMTYCDASGERCVHCRAAKALEAKP